MLRFLSLLVLLVAFLATGMSQPAPVKSRPCGEERWVEAQAMAHRDDEPIRGISATLSTLDLESHLPVCQPVGGTDGFSAALINIANYDRRDQVGGEIVQLGISHGSWDQPWTFMHTADNSGGGMIPLPAPYPENGRAYTFSIMAEEDQWRLTISESGRILHDFHQPATWTDGETGWLMFEALREGSLLGGPSFTNARLALPSGSVDLSPTDCETQTVRWQDQWVIEPGAEGVSCSVVGGFTASQD